jgi:hypothetical protein
VPICPAGHILRRRALGNLTELWLIWALLRGLAISSAVLALGALQDLYPVTGGRRQMGLLGAGACMLGFGVAAFCHAWIWAGMEGPARRLTPRALGMALGFLVPVIPASNALYFHWTYFAAGPSGILLKLVINLSHSAGLVRR